MAINPNDGFKASITRIFHANGAVVGAGFLVSGQYVLTCAHVVAEALGIPNNTTEAPTGSIDLDFPLVAPGQKIKAQVVFWQPMNSSAIGEDIAGLRLEGELPHDAQPGRLVTADELWAHPIRIFGFPSGHINGVWASGVLRDKLANAWVQIEDDKVTGLRIERGFSGAPVWDETLAGVVGMTVAAERQRQEGKVAFIIPTKVLIQAWSILGQSVDVGGKQPLEQGIGSNPVLYSPDKAVPEVKILNEAGINNRQVESNTSEKTIKKMPSQNPIPRIFICYAHKDNESTDPSQRWLDRLLEQLEPLNLQEQAEIWSDEKLEIGDEWHEKIQTTLQQVKAAVLLVSPSFLASKYIRNSEVPFLLKQAKEQGVKILPIILRYCQFNETKFKYPDPKNGPEELSLSTLQVANSPTKPLNGMAEHEQDKVLLSVAQRLRKIINTPAGEQFSEIENASSPISSVQILPNTQRKIRMSKAKQLRLKSLQDELEKLEKDYKAVDEKKRRESNPQERNNLALQLEDIANQMEEIEQKFENLKDEDALIRRSSKLRKGDWEMLFEYFLPYDFADIQRAFLLGFTKAIGHDFQKVVPGHPPLNEQAQIQKLLADHDEPKLAVRFVEFVIVELQRSSEGNNRDLTALKEWRDRIAQNHNISLEEPKPITSTNRQAYLLIALKESGRQTQKDGSFVKVFAELRVTGEETPIDFEAAAVTCSLNEVAEHLSELIRKAEETLISYECDEVTLELFLPCIHLEEDVADWQVKNEQNRPRPLGMYRRFLVRSLERALDSRVRRKLERKWELLKDCMEAKTACDQFHVQEDCPVPGGLTPWLRDKLGLQLLAELPNDREQRIEILYDIINSAVLIALWSSKSDSCTVPELKAQFNNLLKESELTDFDNLAQNWSKKCTERKNGVIKNIRLLCDCPDRWPSFPDPNQEEDLLVAF